MMICVNSLCTGNLRAVPRAVHLMHFHNKIPAFLKSGLKTFDLGFIFIFTLKLFLTTKRC